MKSSNRSFPLIQLTWGYLCTTELQQAIPANDREKKDQRGHHLQISSQQLGSLCSSKSRSLLRLIYTHNAGPFDIEKSYLVFSRWRGCISRIAAAREGLLERMSAWRLPCLHSSIIHCFMWLGEGDVGQGLSKAAGDGTRILVALFIWLISHDRKYCWLISYERKKLLNGQQIRLICSSERCAWRPAAVRVCSG